MPGDFATPSFVGPGVPGAIFNPRSEGGTRPLYRAFPDEMLARNPTVWLRLGESAGTFVDTMVGNDGTEVGTLTRHVADPLLAADDGGISTSSVLNYVSIADSADVDVGDVFSLLIIVSTSTGGTDMVAASKGTGSWNILRRSTNKLALGKPGFAIIAETAAAFPFDGSKHMIGIARNGPGAGNTHIYIDGVEDTVMLDTTSTFIDNTKALHIGHDQDPGNTAPWNGFEDEFAEWKGVYLQAIDFKDLWESRVVVAQTGVLYQLSLDGAIVPAGALVSQPNARLAGATIPAGALTKRVNAFKAGATTPTGALAKLAQKPLAGSITPTGTVANARKAAIALTGAITPTGALIRQAAKFLSGSVTPTGALAKQAQKRFAGGITPTGALTNIKVAVLQLAGGITPTGSIVKRVNQRLAGGTTPTGALSKQAKKPLVGSVTPTGALTKSKLAVLILGGSIAPTGALVRRALNRLAAAVTPVGVIVKRVNQRLAGSVAPSGTLVATNTASAALSAGSVVAFAQVRDTVGSAVALRDTVVIAYGPGATTGATAGPSGSVLATSGLRDSVGAKS